MRQILRDALKDCSTRRDFRFSLRCSECGRVWTSTPVLFSKAGVEPPTEGKRVIYDALFRKERDRALEQAVEEGEQVFSVCPICGRLVCDGCFMVCEDLDMCRACAARLKENGRPVGNGDME